MAQRLVERFVLGAAVDVLLRGPAGESWVTGTVVEHAHPGVWVEAGGGRWFVTNGGRVRPCATVFKIATREEWETTQRTGTFPPNADDVRDGYVHLSTATQVAGTLAKHFAGRTDLVLLEVDVAALDRTAPGALRWEGSRGGKLFPHLYAPLAAEVVAGAGAVGAGLGRRGPGPSA